MAREMMHFTGKQLLAIFGKILLGGLLWRRCSTSLRLLLGGLGGGIHGDMRLLPG